MSEPESKSLTKARLRTERAKHWAGVITLVVTNVVILVTAITAHMKPEKEETARAAYKELSLAVKELSKEQIKLHTDISNMRGYISGINSNANIAIKAIDALEALEAFEPEFEGSEFEDSEPEHFGSGMSAARISKDPLSNMPPISQKPQAYEPPSIGALQQHVK